MKDGSYVVIQSWMLTDYKLKGNELIVYATIYGYTQDGEHWYYGTRGHLAEWCGAQRDTVDRCLKSLIEKGLIERRDVVEYGRTIVQYRATKNAQGAAKTDTPKEKSGTPALKNRHINNQIQPNDNLDNIYAPTIEEVRSYVKEKGYRFDPDQFYAYYDSSGWKMQNGKRVRNWKQCCVTWERNCKGKERNDEAIPEYLREYDYPSDGGRRGSQDVHGGEGEARAGQRALPLWQVGEGQDPYGVRGD